MNIDWELLISAIGLAFVFEGLPYFIAPHRMPKVLTSLASQSPRSLRILGITGIIFGMLLVSLGRSLNS